MVSPGTYEKQNGERAHVRMQLKQEPPRGNGLASMHATKHALADPGHQLPVCRYYCRERTIGLVKPDA